MPKQANQRTYTAEESERHHRYFQVKKSPLGGKGAFAKVSIRKGTLVGAMKGRPVAKDGVHVLWNPTEDGKWELIEVQGPTKYINHSPTPNVELVERKGVVRVRAIRSIPQGEELFFAYDTSEGTHFTFVDPLPKELGSVSFEIWKLSDQRSMTSLRT